MTGTLYVVGTPIGNLEDLSLRAARVLREVELIAAEDTRAAKLLLAHADGLGAANPARRVISYFEGNEAGRAAELVAALRAGQRVAVISEAGMPGVSDPGARAVGAAIEAGARVEVIAGPSAALAALLGSGLPSERFVFLGFPPREPGARRALFGTLRGEAGTMIFYEAPDRVTATLDDLAAALGADRRASLGRELTKVHEEHVRGTLRELAARYAAAPPRGECTLVVEGGAAAPAVDIEAELRRLLGEGLGPKDAAQRLVVVTGVPRRQLYQLALSLQREVFPVTAPIAPFRFDGDLPHLAHHRRQLPCGLDVVVHPDASTPQIAVSIWYRAGSSDERSGRTGLAHLFEHLFKSPPSRLGGHHYEVLRKAGATEANASTSADRSAYHEVVPSHQLDLALWIESDRMGYFADGFDAERLAAQQAVVRAERRQRYEDVPYGAERFAVARGMYPEGHPLRHLTIGLHDDIQAATVDDAVAFYRTWYVPANATLVLAGDVPPDVDARVDRYFGGFPASRRPVRTVPLPVGKAGVAGVVTDRFAALGRVHRAWHGPCAGGDDEPELDVVTAAWAAVGTGALWRRLVYETQLAQRVAAWTVNGRLGGEVHVAVDLRTGADAAAVRAILDEECARGIDARAALRAVTRREAGTVWALAGLARRAQILQRHLLYGDHADGLAGELLRYRAVTPASIDAAIRRWLDPARMVEIETVPADGQIGGAPADRSVD